MLYLANPAGCSPPTRRQMLDDIGALDDLHHAETGDPEILTRVAQYELAYRMQQSVPELTDLSSEPQVDPRHVRPRRAEARQLRRELPARPPPGRARRPVHPALPHGLGPARRPARTRSARSAATPTSPPPRSSRTSSSAGCSRTPWSSGAASSAARSIRRASSRRPTTAATIIRAASPSGWPAAASSPA